MLNQHSAQSDVHRQLLMHCEVINAHGRRSERYVDHSIFDLWRYLLINRHGFGVSAGKPCMWVPEQQWRRHDQLFGQAACNDDVVRVAVKSYDIDSGVCAEHVRFTDRSALDCLSEVLLKHLNRGAQRDMVLHTNGGGAVATSS